MKRIDAIELTDEYEGQRISFSVGETYIAGTLTTVNEKTRGAPGAFIEGIYGEFLFYPNEKITIFGA